MRIHGRDYRIEVNFNALIDFAAAKGEKDLEFLGKPLDVADWMLMLYVCAKEGARLDGVAFDLTLESIGEGKVGEVATVLKEFIEEFQRQVATDEETATETKKKP